MRKPTIPAQLGLAHLFDKMLTEHFLAAIGTTTRKPDTSSATKDAGIFLHEHQPLLAQRHAFKKSASPPNCVAVSQSHIFASQIDKAVVHVYSREKGNQEATVPFPERITSLALALDETVLVLGTEGGRILLWEVCGNSVACNSRLETKVLSDLYRPLINRPANPPSIRYHPCRRPKLAIPP